MIVIVLDISSVYMIIVFYISSLPPKHLTPSPKSAHFQQRKSVHRVLTTNIMKSPIKSLWDGSNKSRRSITVSGRTSKEKLLSFQVGGIDVSDDEDSDESDSDDDESDDSDKGGGRKRGGKGGAKYSGGKDGSPDSSGKGGEVKKKKVYLKPANMKDEFADQFVGGRDGDIDFLDFFHQSHGFFSSIT